MAIIKCKMCGGDLEILEDSSVCECEYCGTKQTVPKVDDEKKLKRFERANRLRTTCEFDKAAGVYETIVADFDQEAEAYWGLILCKFGIEYVDDPGTGKKVPTCHRSSFESLMDDPNFDMVMECADPIARRVYREEAKQIEELRKGIIEVSAKEEPYDVFISYKELDENGERTLDSVIAQDIYTELTDKGYRVFFSRISLESKLGVEYEPYIFAALNSAKVMLVVGTDYDYFNAVWVKNEWSRFLALIASGQKKTLIPVFKGIDAYDMPKEFNKLAAQDMGKIGSMQDLVRGVEKIIGKKQPVSAQQPVQQIVQQVVQSGTNVDTLLKRGFMSLEDSQWGKAAELFDKVLNDDAENAQAYLGLAMADAQCGERADFAAAYAAADSKLRKSVQVKRARQFDSELDKWFRELDEQGRQADREAHIRREKEESKRQTIAAFYNYCQVKNGILTKKAGITGTSIKELVIPEEAGVTSIGDNAFQDCTSLISVTIPESVTQIGEYAFYDCNSLTSVTIPETVTSIGEFAFSNCVSLKHVTIPESVTGIESYAFIGCSGLADASGFVIVKGVLCDYIGSSGDVVIPENVTSIGNSAFDGCKSLTSITIPESVTSIGVNAFTGCSGLADASGFVIVRGVLWDYMGSASNLVIPEGVTSIDWCCTVENGKSLKSVTIPESVISIGSYAFFECKALKCVTIPESVTHIGEDAFNHVTCNDEELTIWTVSGSYADRYAKENRFKVKYIKSKDEQLVELTKERATIKTELANLKGLFSGGKRRQIEARLAEIEVELKKLG